MPSNNQNPSAPRFGKLLALVLVAVVVVIAAYLIYQSAQTNKPPTLNPGQIVISPGVPVKVSIDSESIATNQSAMVTVQTGNHGGTVRLTWTPAEPNPFTQPQPLVLTVAAGASATSTLTVASTCTTTTAVTITATLVPTGGGAPHTTTVTMTLNP